MVRGYGGRALACERFGHAENPPLLLIPGATADSAGWSVLAQTLARHGRHVHLLSMRGHAGSEIETGETYDVEELIADVRELLRQMDSRPVVIAATLAAWISFLAIAEGEPDLASALVMIEACDGQDPGQLVGAARLMAAMAETGEASDFDAGMIAQLDPVGLLERSGRAASRIGIPLLLVRGEVSGLTSHAQLVEFAAKLRNCEIADVPGAGQLNLEKLGDGLVSTIVDFLERRAFCSPLQYVEGSDARTLRDAMGCFATGVTIVTTRSAGGQPVGLTANSFTSVSLDPPLLLVCLGLSAGSLPSLEANEYFAVNVLHVGQRQCSDIFARPTDDRFGRVPWHAGLHDLPILDHSLVSFACRRESLTKAGDHMILLGRVLHASFEPRRDPLLYFRGKYRKLHFA